MKRIAILVCALFALTGCIPSPAQVFGPSQDKINAAQKTSIAAIMGEYSANQVKANKDYSGKWVKLDAFVQDVNYSGIGETRKERRKKVSANAFFILMTDNLNDSRSDGMTCSFGSEHEAAVTALKKGQRITVAGKLTESVVNLADVGLEDCRIVTVLSK